MHLRHVSPSDREARELRFETHVWDNTKDFVRGTVEDHVVTPVQNGEYVKGVFGGLVATGDAVFNGFDNIVVAGLTGERLERLRSNQFRVGRTIKNISSHAASAVGNLLTLHPIKAVGHTLGTAVGGVVGVVRGPGDIAMDFLDEAGGYRKQRPGGANYGIAG